MGDFLSTRVYRYLSKLQAEERKEFANWLASPFWIQRKRDREILGAYFARVEKLCWRKESHEVLEEDIFAGIFPGKPYNQSYFRGIGTLMVQQFMGYISHVAHRKDSYQSRIDEMTALKKREMEKEFLKKVDESRESGGNEVINDGWHLFRYKTEALFTVYRGERQVRDAYTNIALSLRELDNTYLIERFQVLIKNESQKRFLGLYEELEDPLKQEDLDRGLNSDDSTLRIFACLYKLAINWDDHQWYKQAQKILERNQEKIGLDFQVDILSSMHNYLSDKFNKVGLEMLEELVGVQWKMLRVGLFRDNQGRVLVIQFKNLVTLFSEWAMVGGDFSLIDKLLEDFGELVSGDERTQKLSQNYGYGLRALRAGDLEEAISRFNQMMAEVAEVDIYFKLSARFYLTQSYFESDAAEDQISLESLINSSKSFLKYNRNQISTPIFVPYENFYRFATRFKDIREMISGEKKKERMAKLYNQLKSHKEPTAGRYWLGKRLEKELGGLF